jgi:hypothetical protein
VYPFEALKDKQFFSSFTLEWHTLSWSNGADFAPEFLREQVAALSYRSPSAINLY